MVMEEKKRMMRETSDPVAAGIEDPEKVSAEEADADELADTLEKDIDHMKALKIHERKLKRKLNRISEAKKKIRNRVLRRLG
jgi:small-conductance mechanosensitive channel